MHPSSGFCSRLCHRHSKQKRRSAALPEAVPGHHKHRRDPTHYSLWWFRKWCRPELPVYLPSLCGFRCRHTGMQRRAGHLLPPWFPVCGHFRPRHRYRRFPHRYHNECGFVCPEFRVVIGLWFALQPYPHAWPYMWFLFVKPEICPWVSRFSTSGFLRIPPHDGHPYLRLYPSHYRADSGLAPVRNVRPRRTRKNALSPQHYVLWKQCVLRL